MVRVNIDLTAHNQSIYVSDKCENMWVLVNSHQLDELTPFPSSFFYMFCDFSVINLICNHRHLLEATTKLYIS